MSPIAEIRIKLSTKDVEIILSWYENYLEKLSRYGSSAVIFPQEKILVNKIKNASDSKLTLDEFELESITDWMGKALFPKLGGKTYFLPSEETIMNKLNTAMSDLKKKNAEISSSYSDEEKEMRKQEARQLADYFINEKNRRKRLLEKNENEINEIDKKTQRINRNSGQVIQERENKKNRSIDAKIAPGNKLKSQLD